jgi:hypothetical protein
MGVRAADGLNDLMGSTREQVRLGACRSVLDYLMRGHELIEVELRLQALEEAERARGEKR